MIQISVSEGFLYGGLGAMAAAVLLGILCTLVFAHTCRKLKKTLREEYGEPKR